MSVDVLIAEDEPGILESLDFILTRAGWKIHIVTDGETVFDTVRQMKPRVLVLDIMLPRRSGLEILKQIRADTTLKDLPVLMLSAKGQAHDKQTAIELGANAFVSKPYANAEVVEAVRQLHELKV